MIEVVVIVVIVVVVVSVGGESTGLRRPLLSTSPLTTTTPHTMSVLHQQHMFYHSFIGHVGRNVWSENW